MIRKLMATLIQIMDWVNMPFIKPTLQQLKSIFPQRCHVLRYGVLGEGGMNRRSWGALHSSGRNNYVNTCKLFQISICLEWGEWYELRRQTLTVIIGRCCSISDCFFVLGKPLDKKSAVFVQKVFDPIPPFRLNIYVVNFSEGILTKVRKRLSQQLSTK